MRRLAVLACPALVWWVAVGGLAVVAGQTTGKPTPPLAIQSLDGRDLFEFYCASCHGRQGRGDGPVGASLKVPPPDLTVIARTNGGTFPSARVRALVAGDEGAWPGAHGSKEMPVWGPIFRALDPRDTLNRARVANIVSYLESIQQP